MAKRERECEEFEEVSAVVHTSPNAKIHGVVTSLSPMKKAKSCSTHGKYSKLNRSSYLPPLDSPCIHRFFLNLSLSVSFSFVSSEAASLCLRFRALADSPCIHRFFLNLSLSVSSEAASLCLRFRALAEARLHCSSIGTGTVVTTRRTAWLARARPQVWFRASGPAA